MNVNRSLEKQVKAEAEKAKEILTGWKLLETVGPFISVVNMPTAVGLTLIGIAGDTLKSKKALSNTMMPDSWLQEVSNANNISKKGLSFLARKSKDNHGVTVSEALNWLSIEKTENQKLFNLKKGLQVDDRPGVSSIIQRAKLESEVLGTAESVHKVITTIGAKAFIPIKAIGFIAKVVTRPNASKQ